MSTPDQPVATGYAAALAELDTILGELDRADVDVDLLAIGGTGLNAFAGVNGGTDDEIGLRLSGLEFGLALASERADANPATTARTWAPG